MSRADGVLGRDTIRKPRVSGDEPAQKKLEALGAT